MGPASDLMHSPCHPNLRPRETRSPLSPKPKPSPSAARGNLPRILTAQKKTCRTWSRTGLGAGAALRATGPRAFRVGGRTRLARGVSIRGHGGGRARREGPCGRGRRAGSRFGYAAGAGGRRREARTGPGAALSLSSRLRGDREGPRRGRAGHRADAGTEGSPGNARAGIGSVAWSHR